MFNDSDVVEYKRQVNYLYGWHVEMVLDYRIRRNNRTCLNKRTPLPMRKV